MKLIIKKILKLFGLKLVKIRKVPEPNPYGKLDSDVLNSLNDCKGILHLGAHRGTEAEVYNWFGKNVIWVEAEPNIFSILKDNLYFYKNQLCFNALLSNVDDQETNFYVSNYDAATSSIFEFTENIKTSKVWNDRDHKIWSNQNKRFRKIYSNINFSSNHAIKIINQI